MQHKQGRLSTEVRNFDYEIWFSQRSKTAFHLFYSNIKRIPEIDQVGVCRYRPEVGYIKISEKNKTKQLKYWASPLSDILGSKTSAALW